MLPNAAAAAAAAAAQVPAEESVEKKPKESYYELARELLRATPALAAAGFSIKNVAEAIAVRYPFFFLCFWRPHCRLFCRVFLVDG